MSDIKELIERILSDDRFRSSKSFQNAVYKDEPIIQPASHMKNYIPEKIREMKRLASEHSSYYRTEEYTFYRQAKFMENYEDDYSYSGEFISYYPTYQKMRSDQLRGYFTWRGRVRRGEIEKTSPSFAYMYIYELLHLIGCENEIDGFHKLKTFCESYSEIEPGIMHYARLWLVDFAVYYGIDKALIADLIDTEIYSAMHVLKDYDAYSDDELFDAVSAVSSYNIKNSRLYKICRGDVVFVVSRMFRSISSYYEKNRRKTLFEKLFGSKAQLYYSMFSSAVFYDSRKYTDYTYEINDWYKFICRRGQWYCERYYVSRKNKWLGDILRTADSIMRERLEFGHPINCPCDTKWVLSIINKAIDELEEHKKQLQASRIEIDISKLAGIRRSADITRNRLMTEEEQAESVQESAPPQISELLPQTAEDTVKNDTPLTDEEYGFLHSLLYSGSFSGKTMPSVLADSINEKLFDLFQDVVIEDMFDSLVVIEEYAGELKGLIKE